MPVVDDYLATITTPQKAEFERIRKIVKQLVPDAEELISYGIPTFKHKGTYLLYFGAFKNHMSIFPASDELVEAIGEEVKKFRTSKGTLQFTSDKPIPDPVVKKIILHRLADINKK